jgi:benzoyl-CoA reductase/2-hydroxyglutaryl-CoA dehydratase subunit BcrC/BadD/HgdB
MKTIAYSSPFVPAEWIAAHGLQPRRVRPRAGDGGSLPPMTRGVCPYAAAMVGEATAQSTDSVPRLRRSSVECNSRPGTACEQAVAHVLTTTCDQMRYAASMVELRGGGPVFLLNVPSMWQTATARALYRNELERLGRFLEQQGGKRPTDAELTRIMLAGNRAPAYREMAGASGAEAQLASPSPPAPLPVGDGTCGRVSLAVVGGPLLGNDERFFDLIEGAGGCVVLDATEDSQRTAPRPFAPARTQSDPLGELADAYFDGIVDAFRRPNGRLYDWLGRELAAKGVRGIILRRYVWCDLWHAELQRLREWSKLPVLEIDVGTDDTASPNRMQGRIEAFVETLR